MSGPQSSGATASTVNATEPDGARSQSVEDELAFEDLNFVMASPKGRRVIRRLLGPEFCNVNSNSFVPRDTSQTNFNEGKRNIGLRLLAAIDDADPAGSVKLKQTEREDHA